ncbi:MAG: proline--tRNA ligase [Nitrospira sp.]|nr:proline--tRNA ligase [Nitrospira sp.]
MPYYGKELLRFKDRHERDFCLGPTHEEVITDLFRREVRSYRQLPLNFYQIQTKFRDEIRPRFGLMRGREFIMKDAYSFDGDEAGARASYQKMYDAYTRIFTRCGLTFRAVEADTGLIGGDVSHEFMVLAETGEATVAYSDQGSYAANLERAEVLPPSDIDDAPLRQLTPVTTPHCRTVEEVTAFLKIAPRQLIKTLIYAADKETVAVLIRGDHELNEVKLARLLHATEVQLAEPETVKSLTGAPVGFAGPVGLPGVRIVADHAIHGMRNLVVGANRADTHYVDANWDRDFKVDQFADLRNAQTGDPSPRGTGSLTLAKGIEVGQVFLLGTKYSKSMNATILDDKGQERLAVMGCYGIGVGRTAAAAIEQNHDDKGIIWPFPIAPFHVHLLPVSQSAATAEAAARLYEELLAGGFEVLWDDRQDRAGVKFNDADLIGAPFQIVVGDKGLADGVVEVKVRRSGMKSRIAPSDVVAHLRTASSDPG